MTEKAIRIVIPIFFAIYVAIGFGRWIVGTYEIYPFGAWGMYHRLPKYYDDFDLRVHRLAGRDFDPPIHASTTDPAWGIGLDAHRKLVLNAYLQSLRLRRKGQVIPYLKFTKTAMVGPDSKFEILHKRLRSRRRQRDREKTIVHGPFTTSADQPPRVPGERFEFPGSGKFKKREQTGHRQLKRRK
jgi:hypothetical protein